MLTHLQLRDLVLVDQAELELKSGLTALTGETGAGKSIVVDALLLIAGGRAGGDVVRQGAERAEVAASFDALPPEAIAWLEAQSIANDGDLVMRRVIGADGRSRAYVNGQMVPIQALRELAEFLIEIHGQQEFQRLVNRAAQREMLDYTLADRGLREAVSELYARYRARRRDHESLNSAAENRDSRLDLLRYQLAELEAEVTTAAAIEELFVDVKRVAGRSRLAQAARTALDNAQLSLAALEVELAALTREYRAAAQRLTSARKTAADTLGRHITQLMQGLGMAGGRFAVEIAPNDTEFGAK